MIFQLPHLGLCGGWGQGEARIRNSHKPLHIIHGNYILLDIYNQVENMNLQTSKFWITLKKRPFTEWCHFNSVFIISPHVKTYCFSIHKDCRAFWTHHHHFQWTFKFGTNALQTLTKKADCLISYVSKLSLNWLWRKHKKNVSISYESLFSCLSKKA